MNTDRFVINDSNFSIWLEGQDSVKRARPLWWQLTNGLAERGWALDRDGSKYCYCMKGRRGDLELATSSSGRHIEFVFFQNVANVENKHGGLYDSDRMTKMPYLLRLRTELEHMKLGAWCAARGIPRTDGQGAKRGETPAEFVARKRSDDMHWSRGYTQNERERRDADGALMTDGETRYFRGYDGRLKRGVVMANINNMWWVLMKDHHENRASFELFTFDPVKHTRARVVPPRLAREKLIREMGNAVKAEDFERAARLRDVRNRLDAAR